MKKRMNYSIHYSRWHRPTKKHNEIMMTMYDTIYGRFVSKVEPKVSALDFGCGMGFFVNYLIKMKFRNVYGIDADQSQIQASKTFNINSYISTNINEFRKKSGYLGKFNLITCIDVLEHIEKTRIIDILNEIYDNLEPGGMFICSVPNSNSVLAERFRYLDFTHTTSFTEDSLNFVLSNSRFKDISILPSEGNRKFYLSINFKFMFWQFNHLLSRIFRRWQLWAELGAEAFSIPISPNIMAIAKK